MMSTHQTFNRFIDATRINAMTIRLKHNGILRRAWEKGDPYLIYDQVVKILPDMTFATFDDHAQWRTIFHKDFLAACNEIAHVMAGVK